MARLLFLLLSITMIYCQCGNNIRDAGEECDNAGATGCTACVIDAGYTCTGGDTNQGDTCFPTCGDGLKQTGELCDDGNTNERDGCDPFCRIERGASCEGGTTTTPDTCEANCGDGIKIGIENCDDGDVNDLDGCSSICEVEPGWLCDQGTGGRDDICEEVCGDGKNMGNKQCDDKNNYIGDGCDHICITEDGMACTGGNETHYDVCTENCGDGRNIGILPCDDGNPRDGDGCDSACQIETGWFCDPPAGGALDVQLNICYEICGDGRNFEYHDCDDGNLVNGDGCDSNCQVEVGWRCSYGNSTTPDSCWQILPHIINYTLYPDNALLNIYINASVLFTQNFSVNDWLIYASGPRQLYPLDWNVQDFDELRITEHVRDFNITLDWDDSVQFFGEGIDKLHFDIINPNNTRSEQFTWALWPQNITIDTFGMEATTTCGESNFLTNVTWALLIVLLCVNIFAFLTFKISMGYTWSLVLVLQYINFIPLTNVFMPSCLMWYHKNTGLVNGYDHIIRDNFLGRMYHHLNLIDMTRFNYRFDRYGHPYTSFLDNTADIVMCWVYGILFLCFVVMFAEICRESNYYKQMIRLYKWQMIHKGFMVLYLKVFLFSTLNVLEFNTVTVLNQISSLMSIIFFGGFVAYPVFHTIWAFKFKKMPLAEKQKNFVFSEVIFDEFAVYKSIQYFYFWKFCACRITFALVILFVQSPVVQLCVLMGILIINILWIILIRPYRFYIRMFHSVMNDVGGLVLVGMHYQFIYDFLPNEEYFQYAEYCMKAIIGLIFLNIILVIAHWIFELIIRLFPSCCFNFRKKLQKADADDESVAPEAESLPSEESEPAKVIIKPPVEIVIPAAGVLVEKGNEYQFQQDIVKEKKKEMPKEEFKEIKPANVDNDDDDDYIIDKKKTPTGLDNSKNATGTGLFGNTLGGTGLFER